MRKVFEQGSCNLQYKGKPIQLAATPIPSTITEYRIVWSSSNEKVAKTDAFGSITPVGKDKANITAAIDRTEHKDTREATVNYAWWQWIIRIVLFGWLWY